MPCMSHHSLCCGYIKEPAQRSLCLCEAYALLKDEENIMDLISECAAMQKLEQGIGELGLGEGGTGVFGGMLLIAVQCRSNENSASHLRNRNSFS